MSQRQLAQAAQNFVKQLRHLPRDFAKAIVAWFLRAAFILQRRSRLSATGFILPTVVLLILIVTLTVGALVYRAFNSSSNTIASNQNKVIYNAATPAIDRARAKLEFLFDADKDTRFPSGVPSEGLLMSMLLNDGSTVKGTSAGALTIDSGKDPYILPDEKRVDLDGDTKKDNAWAYRADTNGDDIEDATVVYSIIFSTPLDEIDGTTKAVKTYGWQRLIKFSDKNKADGETDGTGTAARTIPYVRSGPLSNSSGKECGGAATSGATVESGWFKDLVSTSILRKNFQVDALVIPDAGKGGFSTLEFQQDRQLDSGNKWGAWFRNDLEINPGSPFQWNGAMHTEGSFAVGFGSNFTAQLISSPNSCLYFPASNSEITVTKQDPNPNSTDADAQAGFQGLFMSANIDNSAGTPDIYIWSSASGVPPKYTLDSSSDWTNLTVDKVDNIRLDDIKVKTLDGYRAKGASSTNNANSDLTQMPTAAGGQKDDGLNGRFRAAAEAAPYVDDLYRADDRYGPKYRYNGQIAIPTGKTSGQAILSTDNLGANATPKNLTEKNRDASGSANAVGLDGYWERRARIQGLRVLVGERLNFGNTFGWQNASATKANRDGTKDDPLYPASALSTTTRAHEAKQRRALRDNIAAVQGTAIYHAATSNYDKPVACLASTAHPGTVETLERSLNFVPSSFVGGSLVTDFFNGRGTNGWEFAPPDITNTSVQSALKNLATFAGELDGAFPPKQETGKIHPDPVLTMWGNFSNLNRALDTTSNNSIADSTYQYTAACTLGMLAYNIAQLDNFDPFATGQTVTTLTGTPPTDVTYSATLKQVATKIAAIPNYDTKKPEELLVALKPGSDKTTPYLGQGTIALTPGSSDDNLRYNGSNDAILRYAELIVTKAQVLRDRKYGFATSPVASTPIAYAYDVALGLPTVDTLSGLTADEQKAIAKLYGTVAKDKNNIDVAQPKWPFLYYIFRNGSGVTQPTTPTTSADADLYSSTVSSVTGYGAVTATSVALTPRKSDLSDWALPVLANANIKSDPRNTNPNRIVNSDGKTIAVGFLDKVNFNGREWMPTRLMSIDLGLLRRTPVAGSVALPASGTASGGTEYGTKETWLPASGIVYAFREDAVREDGISRPSGGTYSLTALAGRTNAVPGSEADPALAGFGISVKPIDFVADPDRRPHGFRLVNGSHLRRVNGVGTADNIRGLSFFTDNPVAIQGDFNIHETIAGEDAKGNPLEEFDERVWQYVAGEAQPSQSAFATTFYGRKTRSTAFASSNPTTGDHWRPSEILSDATSIFAESFCDGSLDDTFENAGLMLYPPSGPSSKVKYATKYAQVSRGLFASGATNCFDGGSTSFLNQNRPDSDPTTTANGSYKWLRENPADVNSPVKISANGEPLLINGTAVTEYGKTGSFGYYLPTGSNRGAPSVSPQISDGLGGHRVNTILISGLVPSRANQYNGGLHNFPRFLESWSSRQLWFSGSLIQLNYSNYGTALFDQYIWEPAVSASSANSFKAYYAQPLRYWGYDVALQLAPAGPAASRFVTVSKSRNEFYSEIPVNDPYMNKLCSAAKTAKTKGDITTKGPINCPA